MQLKKDLRKQMLAKRLALTKAEVEKRSQLIATHFFNNFQKNSIKVVHIFLPITSKNEINTWYIIKRFWIEYPEIQLVVPVTDFEKGELKHVLLTPETKLHINHWGISEPVQSEAVNEIEIDLVLVPLLAVDKQGHRVGYGKGFYDRFFIKCRKSIIKTGLSFEEPILQIADVHEGDIYLDNVITPAGLIQFTR